MNKRLIIIGAGGHGKVCANVASDMKRWDDIAFLDDFKKGSINGHKIIGDIRFDKINLKQTDFFVGLGDSQLREKFITELTAINASIVNLIHPTAYCSNTYQIGQGSIVMAKAVISTSVKLGSGVIINSGAIIEHDCQMGDWVHVSPGVNLAGNVSLGKHTWVGIGSTIVNNLKISDKTIIGAQSLVLKNIDEPGTYFGHPIHKRV